MGRVPEPGQGWRIHESSSLAWCVGEAYSFGAFAAVAMGRPQTPLLAHQEPNAPGGLRPPYSEKVHSFRTFAAVAMGRPQMSMKPAALPWLKVSPWS